MKRNIKKTALALVIFHLVMFTGLGWWRWHSSLPRKFAAVVPGVLYRSGQGSAMQFRNAIDREQIKTIVCLRQIEPQSAQEWLDAERAVADERHVTFVHWPTPSGEPVSEESILQFLKMTQDSSRTPLLVHCGLGRHRTGFLAAVYRRVIDDWPLEKALKEMESFEFDLTTHGKLVAAIRELDVGRLRANLKGAQTQPTF
jgi:protein tyrosine/serine phosphatase